MEDKTARRGFWIFVAILWTLIALRIRWLYLYGKPGPAEPGTPPEVTP
jgi:hypothetical protein